MERCSSSHGAISHALQSRAAFLFHLLKIDIGGKNNDLLSANIRERRLFATIVLRLPPSDSREGDHLLHPYVSKLLLVGAHGDNLPLEDAEFLLCEADSDLSENFLLEILGAPAEVHASADDGVLMGVLHLLLSATGTNRLARFGSRDRFVALEEGGGGRDPPTLVHVPWLNLFLRFLEDFPETLASTPFVQPLFSDAEQLFTQDLPALKLEDALHILNPKEDGGHLPMLRLLLSLWGPDIRGIDTSGWFLDNTREVIVRAAERLRALGAGCDRCCGLDRLSLRPFLETARTALMGCKLGAVWDAKDGEQLAALLCGDERDGVLVPSGFFKDADTAALLRVLLLIPALPREERVLRSAKQVGFLLDSVLNDQKPAESGESSRPLPPVDEVVGNFFCVLGREEEGDLVSETSEEQEDLPELSVGPLGAGRGLPGDWPDHSSDSGSEEDSLDPHPRIDCRGKSDKLRRDWEMFSGTVVDILPNHVGVKVRIDDDEIVFLEEKFPALRDHVDTAKKTLLFCATLDQWAEEFRSFLLGEGDGGGVGVRVQFHVYEQSIAQLLNPKCPPKKLLSINTRTIRFLSGNAVGRSEQKARQEENGRTRGERGNSNTTNGGVMGGGGGPPVLPCISREGKYDDLAPDERLIHCIVNSVHKKFMMLRLVPGEEKKIDACFPGLIGDQRTLIYCYNAVNVWCADFVVGFFRSGCLE